MGWIASFFVALLTGVVSLFMGAFIGERCVRWYRISSFEGGSGYFMIAIALLGGIAGFVLSLITCRIVAGSAEPGFLKGLGYSMGLAVGIASVVLLLARLNGDIPPEIDGQELTLEVEVRLPVQDQAKPVATKDKDYIWFTSINSLSHVSRGQRHAILNVEKARHEGGRWIIPASVFLFTQRGDRGLSAYMNGVEIGGFIIPLPARPGREYLEWSRWLPVALNGTEPWPDDRVSYRFRVALIVPPPPAPDPEDEETAAYQQLTPEAPLAEWLQYLRPDIAMTRFNEIMDQVNRRPDELVELIRSDEEETRERALFAVTAMRPITEGVRDAVLAEAKNVADGVRRFNTLAEDDPDFYNLALTLRSRFSYWHRAWWSVHLALKLDGAPPVKEILDLAEVRAKDTSMSEIVANATAHLEGVEKLKSSSEDTRPESK